MQIEYVRIDHVEPLVDRQPEYDERVDQDDVPTGTELGYFALGHRVMLDFTDGDGNRTAVMDTDENVAAIIEGLSGPVNEYLVGVPSACNPAGGWRFSRQANCTCPCSPGFIVAGTGTGTELDLTVVARVLN